jgi:hypothetical protein
MEAVNNSKNIVEIHKEDAINVVCRDVKDNLTGGSVVVLFDLDGEREAFDIQELPEDFHISPKSITEDSPQLPESEEWKNAFINEEFGSFAREIFEDVEEHQFTTEAIAYDEEYYERPIDKNVNRKEVIVEMVD